MVPGVTRLKQAGSGTEQRAQPVLCPGRRHSGSKEANIKVCDSGNGGRPFRWIAR